MLLRTMDWKTVSPTPKPSILLANEIQSIRLFMGNEIREVDILYALTTVGNNTVYTINFLLEAIVQIRSGEGESSLKLRRIGFFFFFLADLN